MAFFNREANSPSSPAPGPVARPAPSPPSRDAKGAAEATHIADGSKVVGKITGSAEIIVDGELEGEIVLDSRVVVGPRGRVRGKIEARAVQVAGKVHGNVHGTERIEVLASGTLEGDVVSPRVVISEGAFFKGKVEMSDKAAKPAPAAPAAPAAKPEGAKPEGARPEGAKPAATAPEAAGKAHK
jgi:cytoskeletal protein CcmA (bactofilin family)